MAEFMPRPQGAVDYGGTLGGGGWGYTTNFERATCPSSFANNRTLKLYKFSYNSGTSTAAASLYDTTAAVRIYEQTGAIDVCDQGNPLASYSYPAGNGLRWRIETPTGTLTNVGGAFVAEPS